MSSVDQLFAKLQSLGAGEFAHLNGSLATHLRGTEALLREWGAADVVCVAGQRVIELEAEEFRFDPNYPDLKTERNDDFALIEILWSVGRSVKVKRKLLEELMGTLAHAGFETGNVMVCFKETSWENGAFAGGRLIHT
jgi:Tautomerase enzyme